MTAPPIPRARLLGYAALPATLIFFFVEHDLASSRGPVFLVLYLGLGFLLVPAWVQLARRWEKKHA